MFFDSFEAQMKAETKAAEEGGDKYGLRFTQASAALRQTLLQQTPPPLLPEVREQTRGPRTRFWPTQTSGDLLTSVTFVMRRSSRPLWRHLA